MNVDRSYKRISFIILFIVLAVSFAGGFFSIKLTHDLSATRDRMLTFEERLVETNRVKNVLQEAFGYGGFIHNFKNYVLRHDPVYKQHVISDYGMIRRALDDYAKYATDEADRKALGEIRATADAYEKNLAVAETLIAQGAPIAEIDRQVRVDDTSAIAALRHLDHVWDADFARRQPLLSRVVEIGQFGTLVVDMTIASFMGIAVLMFWWIIKFEGAWRQSVRDLRSSETRFREIVSNTGDGIITISAEGKIESFNRAATNFFGYEEPEVIGKNVSMLMPEEEREHHDHYVANSSVYQNKVINSVRGLNALRRDGSLFPIELNIAPFFVDGKKSFVGILRDITEKQKAEEVLLQTMKSAIDAHATKNLFIANMNHELRTPLNAIIGYSDVMMMELFGAMPSSKYMEYATDINNAGRHLLAIISDLLDLGAIEEGKLELNKQFMMLAEIVNDSLKLIKRQAEVNGIKVEYNLSDFDISLVADARRLKQVLLNILGNSIKFTLKGGVISMSCIEEQDEVVVLIEDTGVGVSKKDLELIFEPFQQAKETSLLAKEGTGLGLPLSKNLIELHGGTMEFSSELGKGSNVVIRLPRNLPDDPPSSNGDGFRRSA